MHTEEILEDAFFRIKGIVHSVLKDVSEKDLAYRAGQDANTIAWLVWHLTRIQDDHIAGLAQHQQVWPQGWEEKFNLDLDQDDNGYGHSSNEVDKVKISSELLLGYYDAVHSETIKFIKKLKPEDYALVVDTNWNPPVKLGVRLVSVISDDLQHAGQAAFIKGLIKT